MSVPGDDKELMTMMIMMMALSLMIKSKIRAEQNDDVNSLNF